MAPMNDVSEYLVGIISQLLDKTSLKMKVDSIDERLSRLEEQLKILTNPKSHDRREERHSHPKKAFEPKREEQQFVYDLHGNKVPMKETMQVKKYSYDGAKQGRCKVWGCDERAFDKGYCGKHRDKYYQKEGGSREQPLALHAHEERKPEVTPTGKSERKKNHRRKVEN